MQLAERNIVKAVAKLAPWLAPSPSAYFVARATVEHLDTPLWLAVVAGVIIESLGLVSVYNFQWFADWNGKKLKSDAPAPVLWPALLGGFYLLVTIALVVVLEVIPDLATYAPACFPLLALVGTVNLALIAGQEQRETEAETAKRERKQQRQERKQRKAAKAETRQRQPETPKAETAAGNGNGRQPETATGNGNNRKRKPGNGNGNDTRQQAAAILAEMPDISGAELGRQLGKSERMGRILRADLLPEIAVSGNGNGVLAVSGNGRG